MRRRRARWVAGLAMAVLALAGCGPRDAGPGIPVAVPPGQGGALPTISGLDEAVVSGSVMFEDIFVVTDSTGMNGTVVEATRPVRAGDVVLLDPVTGSEVQIARASTTDTGSFSIRVRRQTPFQVGFLASTSASGGRADLEVRDSLRAGFPVHMVVFNDQNGDPFEAGPNVATVTFTTPALIPTDPVTERASGAWNILDAALTASDRVRTLTGRTPSRVSFFWAPDDPEGSFFVEGLNGGPGIQIRGGDSDVSDTDEFDDSVISHEYGHFVTFDFSRDSSLGGGHRVLDSLYPTLAWSEGWANFFAGMVNDAGTNPHLLVTTSAITGPTPLAGVTNLEFELENAVNPPVGLGVEASVMQILWDLFDGPAGPQDFDFDAVDVTDADLFGPFTALRVVQPAPYVTLNDFLLLFDAQGQGPVPTATLQLLLTAPTNHMVNFPPMAADLFPQPIMIGAAPQMFTCETRIELDTKLTGDESSNIFRTFTLGAQTPITLTMTLTNGTDLGSNADGSNIDLELLDVDNFFAVDALTLQPLTPVPRPDAQTVETALGTLAPGTYIIRVSGIARDPLTGDLANQSSRVIPFSLQVTSP